MEFKYVDLKYLNEMSGGDKGLITEMIQIFNSEVPGYLTLMNKYNKDKKWESLGKLAHKAKASASIMGMHQLTNELRNLELLAKDKKETHTYPSLIQSIEQQFNGAMDELGNINKTL